MRLDEFGGAEGDEATDQDRSKAHGDGQLMRQKPRLGN